MRTLYQDIKNTLDCICDARYVIRNEILAAYFDVESLEDAVQVMSCILTTIDERGYEDYVDVSLIRTEDICTVRIQEVD